MEEDGEFVYHPDCRHTFHGECLSEWHAELNRRGETLGCPVCRGRLESDMTVVVFSHEKKGEVVMDEHKLYYCYEGGRVRCEDLPSIVNVCANVISHLRGPMFTIRKMSRSSRQVFMSSTVCKKDLLGTLRLYTLRIPSERQKRLLARDLSHTNITVIASGVVYTAQKYIQESLCKERAQSSSILLKTID